METASFSGTLKVIFYIILFYYIFKFLMRLFLPVLLKKAASKMEENMRQHEFRTQGNPETAYNTAKPSKPRETKKVGEYVDFEEIE